MKDALEHSDRIAHIGTESLYHYLSKSLTVLDVNPDSIFFHKITPGKTVEEQTAELISKGYQVIIGGYASKTTAERLGAYGIEISVDHTVIEATILNAHNMAQDLKHKEQKEFLHSAVLNAANEPILAITHVGKIIDANNSAKRLLGQQCIGMDFLTCLQEKNLVDIDSITIQELDSMGDYTPVILKRTLLSKDAVSAGQVITIDLPEKTNKTPHKRRDLILKGFYAENTFENITGASDSILSIKEKARKYACFDSTMLITGESGTGKELFAQSVHNASRRKAMPFVPVNCAALPNNLIESELFGYEKGAFTGAGKEGKPGLFEMANGGTIFLDEISEIPITTQAKLLRVIEEGDVIRIGGDHINVVDVRVICTSNKDLLKMIQDGQFKEDLYYRLSVLEINVPPLRDRKEDIEALSATLLQRFCNQHKRNIVSISPDVISALKRLPFRGNVRELSNIIERMVIFSEEDTISIETMKQSLNRAQLKDIFEDPPAETAPVVSSLSDSSDTETARIEPSVQSRNLEDMQKDLILKTLAENNGNKAATARALGIDTSTLWRKLKKYNM